MKFEDMKKIWDEQNNQHFYVIDEENLQRTIGEKKRKGSRYVSKMEWMLIGSNLLAGGAIISMNFIKSAGDIYSNLLGLVMLLTAVYICFKRLQRLKYENSFDRTMLGDLEHAIANATYRARLSYGMLLYFILVAVLVLGNAIYEDKSVGKIILIAAFLVVTWLLGHWEHKSWHVANRKRLEAMRDKLTEPV